MRVLCVTGIVMIATGCTGDLEPTVLNCPTVDFELTKGAGLGVGAGPFSPSQESVVAAFAGGYAVAPTYTEGTVAIHDAQGVFMRSTGTAGAGPGEFRRILDVAVIRDSIIVADRRLSRISVLDPDGQFARAFSVSGLINRVLPIGEDTLLVYTTPTPGSELGALQLFHRSDDPILTFPRGDNIRGGRSASDAREVAVTDSFVVAGRRSYLWFELFDHHGTYIREIRPRAEWFRGFDPRKLTRIRGAGVSVLEDLAGSGNMLFALTRTENENAERFVDAARAQPNAMTEGIGVALQDSVFDYWIAAIDLRKGCVAGATRLRHGVYSGFVGDTQLAEILQLPEGDIVIQLWSLELLPQT